jgi:hypothetical protein
VDGTNYFASAQTAGGDADGDMKYNDDLCRQREPAEPANLEPTSTVARAAHEARPSAGSSAWSAQLRMFTIGASPGN